MIETLSSVIGILIVRPSFFAPLFVRCVKEEKSYATYCLLRQF